MLVKHSIHTKATAATQSIYKFYDLASRSRSIKQQSPSSNSTPPSPNNNISSSDNATTKPPVKSATSGFVFEGNASDTPSNNIMNIFGGRLAGEKAVKSSSRYSNVETTSKPFHIAGVPIPSPPTEPDNCCMSGCINCVWELYNDDMKNYNHQRKLAAEKLKQQGGVWPAKYDPPVKWLAPENLPEEVKGKPMNQETKRWESVSMSVFADFEKNLKKKGQESHQ